MISGCLLSRVLLYINYSIASYLWRQSAHHKFSSSISDRPFSILLRRSNVFLAGISLIPWPINPNAILSELFELSKAISFICSPFCLKSSMPLPRRSFVIIYVAELEATGATFLSSFLFSAAFYCSFLLVGG